jgi:ABC-2 type transport system ATP-binding protein
VTVLGVSGDATRLALDAGADDQVVLRAALATGPVHEFSHVRPSLTDLFRHLVGAAS